MHPQQVLIVSLPSLDLLMCVQQAAEVASFIQQKRDMGYKSTAAVQTVDQIKDHLGAGKHFWAALQGDKECQGKLPHFEKHLWFTLTASADVW